MVREKGASDEWAPDFTTDVPDEAIAVIRESYRVAGVRVNGDTDSFTFSQRIRKGGGFALGRFRCSAEISYDGPLSGLLCVAQVNRGRLAFMTGRGELQTTADQICLVPPHDSWRAVTTDIDLAPLVLDRNRVTAHAAGLADHKPKALVFTGLEPLSASRLRLWKAAVAHVGDTILGDVELASSPLIQAEAFRLLTHALLLTFPNTALVAGGEAAGPPAGSAAVRRAVTFMDEHAHEAMTLDEVAAAARLSPRGLQSAFRRHRGEAPMAYLRGVRMQRAHRDLEDGDPTRGDTVRKIATRWGFHQAGRFAVDYRRLYGCPPSRTLAH